MRLVLVADGPGRGLRVELVRVVEHGGLGRPRGLPVVVDGDRVQELGPGLGVQARGPFLDQPQAEMDMTEQAPLLGLAERRAASELDGSPDVVQERGGEEEIVAEARVELRRLAAEGGDTDRVLEQPTGVAVVPVGAGGR